MSDDALASRSGDGGFASIEFAVLFVPIVLMIVVVFQLSLWGVTRSAVISAAHDAASQAAVRNSADAQFLQNELSNQGLDGLGLTSLVSADADRVIVRIDGSMPALFGPFSLPLHAVASAPVEHFRP